MTALKPHNCFLGNTSFYKRNHNRYSDKRNQKNTMNGDSRSNIGGCGSVVACGKKCNYLSIVSSNVVTTSPAGADPRYIRSAFTCCIHLHLHWHLFYLFSHLFYPFGTCSTRYCRHFNIIMERRMSGSGP